MADSVEASSRSLQHADAETIDQLVEQIINKQIEQNQYINSPITLKDISDIKKIFKKMLMSIFADYKQLKKDYMISRGMDPTKEYDNKIVSLDVMYYKLKYINSDPKRKADRIANLVVLLAAKSKTDDKKKK